MPFYKKIEGDDKNTKSKAFKKNEIADYYDNLNILDELKNEEIEIRIAERSKDDILSAKRIHRMPSIYKKEIAND